MSVTKNISSTLVFLSLSLLFNLLFFVNFKNACAQQVQITDMDDFSFGGYSGSGDLTQTDGDICIYQSGGTGTNYQVTASGTGPGGSFQIQSGMDSISYEVSWKPSQGTGGSFTSVTANSGHSFNGADNASTNCGGSANAALRVHFPNASLSTAAPGNYSGTLTIRIDPL